MANWTAHNGAQDFCFILEALHGFTPIKLILCTIQKPEASKRYWVPIESMGQTEDHRAALHFGPSLQALTELSVAGAPAHKALPETVRIQDSHPRQQLLLTNWLQCLRYHLASTAN